MIPVCDYVCEFCPSLSVPRKRLLVRTFCVCARKHACAVKNTDTYAAPQTCAGVYNFVSARFSARRRKHARDYAHMCLLSPTYNSSARACMCPCNEYMCPTTCVACACLHTHMVCAHARSSVLFARVFACLLSSLVPQTHVSAHGCVHARVRVCDLTDMYLSPRARRCKYNYLSTRKRAWPCVCLRILFHTHVCATVG